MYYTFSLANSIVNAAVTTWKFFDLPMLNEVMTISALIKMNFNPQLK